MEKRSRITLTSSECDTQRYFEALSDGLGRGASLILGDPTFSLPVNDVNARQLLSSAGLLDAVRRGWVLGIWWPCWTRRWSWKGRYRAKTRCSASRCGSRAGWELEDLVVWASQRGRSQPWKTIKSTRVYCLAVEFPGRPCGS